jgi:2,3-diketo-5-methylthio-1-phosphopentane phosphatase
MKIVVVSDFDGTISIKDVGYKFFEEFVGGEWEEIDKDYKEGKIGSKEAYLRIMELFKGSKEEIMEFINRNSSIDPYFKDFYKYCEDNNIDLKIVSDGFELYIDIALKKEGIYGIDIYSNRLIFNEKGKITVEFPYSYSECSDCGNCKLLIVNRLRKYYSKVIYIGDGISDVCAIKGADYIYSKRYLYNYCIKEKIACKYFGSFRDIIGDFKDILTTI